MLKKLSILVILSLIVLIKSTVGFTYQKIYKSTEICGSHNGHRRYLEFGETGEIFAHNISVPNVINQPLKWEKIKNLNFT